MPGEALPRTLGRYEIRGVIGRGMMGVVYEAVDPALGRTVALKTIHLAFGITDHERRVFEERFQTEARLAAGLSHPNIVVVHDVGWDEETGTPFMALEFLKGETLGDRLEEGLPLDWRESLRVTAKVADALHVAHQAGVVHRDVKPANIMLLPNGEPKIMDFGIAKAPASQLTAAGDVFGTPSYMSPEQATGVAVDGRSDIFSMGTILYQMLTGQRAFDAPNVPAILSRVTHDPPVAPTQLNPGLPPSIELVLSRALAKDPAQRYADGREMAEDLEDLLAGRPLRDRPGLATRLLGSAESEVPTAPRAADAPPAPEPQSPATTASLVDNPVRASAIAAGGPPVRPRSPLAPGLALAGMLVLAVVSGAVAIGLTRGDAPGLLPQENPETALADLGDAPAVEPSPVLVGPEPMPEESPEPTAQPVAGRSRPQARPSPTPAPPVEAEASDAPTATAVVAAPTPRPGPPPARLLLRVEHSMRRGELRVLAPDGSLVFRHRLRGEEGKRLGVFTTHRGDLEETIEVPAGTYFVRVQAFEDEDKKKAGLLRGTFRSGQTRVLEVKVGSTMELRWR